MKACSKCGKKLTFFNRDLTSDRCAACAREEKQQRKEAEKAAAEARDREYRNARAEQTRKTHGIPTVYPDGCPDCGSRLEPVSLFAREEFNFRQGMGVDSAVRYYCDANEEQGIVSGRHTIGGHVKASMCSACYRIFLHGIPHR